MRRRRPLMRAAMVGGGAYMVGKNAQRGQTREQEQEQRLNELEASQAAPAAAQPTAAAPAPAPAPQVDVIDQLTKLKALLDAGVLTQAEFDGQKQKLLGA